MAAEQISSRLQAWRTPATAPAAPAASGLLAPAQAPGMATDTFVPTSAALPDAGTPTLAAMAEAAKRPLWTLPQFDLISLPKQKAEAEAKQAAEAKAKQEAEAKQKAEAKAKQAAEAKAKQEAEAKQKAEAEAKKKAEAEAKQKAAAPATVTVQSGDSLSAIAGRTLGNADRWREIFDLNRDQISDPNQISAGQVLKLPGGAQAPAPPPAPAKGGPNKDRNAIFMKQPNNWTCGPTSLTMAAAAFGVRPLNVNTVNELTDKSRTRPEYGVPDRNALPQAANAIGLQAQAHVSGNAGMVRAALQAGKGVIVNGTFPGSSGHYVYVAGLNPDGSFIVCDPWRPEIKSWSDAGLNEFNKGRSITEIWR